MTLRSIHRVVSCGTVTLRRERFTNWNQGERWGGGGGGGGGGFRQDHCPEVLEGCPAGSIEVHPVPTCPVRAVLLPVITIDLYRDIITLCTVNVRTSSTESRFQRTVQHCGTSGPRNQVSQMVAAEWEGVSQPYLSNLESGKFGSSLNHALRLLRLLGYEVVVRRGRSLNG